MTRDRLAYLVKLNTEREIADMCGVSQFRVQQWVKRWGLQRKRGLPEGFKKQRPSTETTGVQ